MSRANIVSVCEEQVQFDALDGGGFGLVTLVTVVTVSGVTYVWRGSATDEMLDWIDRDDRGESL